MNDFSVTARLAWAAAHGGMESPLVNEYKKPFIIRRLLETFLGGLKLLTTEDAPTYVFITQVLLFSVVVVLASLFIALEHQNTLTLTQAFFISAVLHFLYSLFLQIIAHFLRSQKSKTGDIAQVSIASDEEQVEFDTPFGPKTWSFYIREKKLKGGALVHSLLVGLVGGSVVYYARPASTYQFHVPWGMSLAFSVLGVLTHSVGVWPLIGGSPPEPATFHPLSWDLPALSRSIHMLTCVLVHFIASYHPELPWLLPVDGVCHMIYATAPVLWLLGILPPIDAYILWLLEQFLVLVLGGSPMSSTRRLASQVFVGTLTLLTTAALPSFPAIMVFAACRGFLLSVDSAWLVSSLLSPRVSLLTGLSGKYDESWPTAPGQRSLRRITCQRELGLVVPMLVAVAGMSFACQLPNSDWFDHVITATREGNLTTVEDLPRLPALFQEPSRNAVGLGLLVIAGTMLVVHEVQKVYLLGLVRNPLFSCHKALQRSNAIYIYSQLLIIGFPLVSLMYLHQVVSGEVHLQMAAAPQTFHFFLLTVPLARIMRQIWQFPQASYVQLSMYVVVELIQGQRQVQLAWWSTLSPATRILLLSLAYLWGSRAFQKLHTIMLFLVTPFTEKKQKNSVNFFLIGFNIAIAPILLGLVVVSAVLCAPLLPVFTLPIFLLGFPRPLRFWSYPVGRSSNSCEDSVYYEQLTPHVIFCLHNLLQSGTLGITEPGEHFLLRWEDRFIWVQILESGFTYQYYSVKGLELQETSCHTAEASRVDSNFSRAFDTGETMHQGTASQLFNSHACHTLTPLTHFEVMGYSDTRNVLTGVIDSPDTLNIIKDYFHKALLYVVMNYIICRSTNTTDTHSETERPINSASRSRSQDHLKNLPRVHSRTGNHIGDESFERESDSAISLAAHQPSAFTRRHSFGSRQSQSGRGSRMAWSEDNHSTLTAADSPPHPPSLNHEDSFGDVDEGDNWIPNKKSRKSQFYNGTEREGSLSPSDSAQDANHQIRFIPGLMYDSSDEENESRTIRTQATYHGAWRSGPEARVNVRMISQPEPWTPIYESPISAALAPLPNWIMELPFDSDVIDEVQDTFPHAWFKFLLNTFGHYYSDHLDKLPASKGKASGTSKTSETSETSQASSAKPPGGERDTAIQRMQYDETLEDAYRQLVGTCHLILLGTEGLAPAPSQVYKTFSGEVSWSPALDWLIHRPVLYGLALQAYRIGVKLSLDHTLIGGLTGWAELKATMEDYTQHWYLGPDSRPSQPPTQLTSSPDPAPNSARHNGSQGPQSWAEAVRFETLNLFSLGYSAVKGVYTSHLLTLGEAEMAVGRLGGETVRGLWASLVAELLYLTNDDDERYSIQAHPGLLRNLTIQAADPPLGYPIFASPPLRMAAIWLSATYQQIAASEHRKSQ